MPEINLEQLKRRLSDPGIWPLIGDLGKECVDALETLQQELGCTKTSLTIASNALSYAESQASEWRCKAGTLENELRRAGLDKTELQVDLEEVQSLARSMLDGWLCMRDVAGPMHRAKDYFAALDAARQQQD